MGDGVFGSLTLGFVEAYFVPLAIALRASAAQIAQISALPTLIGALAQSQATALTTLLSGRKQALRGVVFSQALMLLLVPALLILPPENRVAGLLGLFVAYMIFGGLASPLWGSMMSEYLPSNRRSGYFGWRQRILGLVLVGSNFAAGIILSAFGKGRLAGFALIFALAGACRLISFWFMGRMHDPDFRERRRVPRPRPPDVPLPVNFVRFAIFCGLMGGSINLVAPFFPVYLLQTLGYGYLTYTILVIASQAMMFFMMAHWGWHADHSGNLKVIRMVSWAMPVVPLLWILPPSAAYFFFVQAASGLLWAGYNLCTTNFIYDAVPSQQRIRATVVFNMFNGFCGFAGAWIGGQLLPIIPPVWGERFFTLALVSAAVRVLVLIVCLPAVREVREVTAVRSLDLFYSILRLRPLPAMARADSRFPLRTEA
jgi:MFS family permease